jgi:aminopeptidase N
MCRHHHLVAERGSSDFATTSAEAHYAPHLGLEPVHLDLDLAFDPTRKTAHGTVVTTVLARQEQQRVLILDAVSFVSVMVDSADGHALSYTYDGAQIVVTWAEAFALGETRRVAVQYTVKDPLSGLMFSENPSFIATDHETQRARYWLPCVDHPSVRTTLTFQLRAPEHWEILANGTHTGDVRHNDGTRTASWKLDQRCPAYLLCLSMGDFARVEGGTHRAFGKEVEIAFFSPKRDADTLERTFGPTRSMMDWMVKRLDRPFPFPKYYQFSVPAIGGAMENISLVSWDDFCLMDERANRDRRLRIDAINVHEMAHSYFGDSVVIRDYSHAWLKESWASYMEAVWVEDTYGRDEADFYISEEIRDYRSEADGRYIRPIVTRHFDSAWDMFDMHLYPGGSCRLHMLRRRLGERAFWDATRDYLTRFDGKTAETSDFQRCLEEHSGLSLASFFDQWIYSAGYPSVRGSFRFDDAKHEAVIVLEQTQASVTKNVPVFELPLTVAMETSEGTWTRQTVKLGARNEIKFPSDTIPLAVVIDPAGDSVFSLEWFPGVDMLARALKSPTITGRIQAARSLGTRGTPDAIRTLESAYRSEPFWGVRIEIARALDTAGTQPALDVLSRISVNETDDRVLPHLARAMGSRRDVGNAESLRALLQRDLGDSALVAVLESLGQHRDPRDIDTLASHARAPCFWGWAQRGALSGLGRTRNRDALPHILAATLSTERRQVRIIAAESLGALGRWLEPADRARCIERLTEITRDGDYGTRLAAVRGLAALGAHEASDAFAAAEKMAAEQDIARIRRAAKSTRGVDGGGEIERLKKRIEDLEERFRKVESRAE